MIHTNSLLLKLWFILSILIYLVDIQGLSVHGLIVAIISYIDSGIWLSYVFLKKIDPKSKVSIELIHNTNECLLSPKCLSVWIIFN